MHEVKLLSVGAPKLASTVVRMPELAPIPDEAPATVPVLAAADELAAPLEVEVVPVLALLTSESAADAVGPTAAAPGCGLNVILRLAARMMSSSVGGSPYLSARQARREVVSGPMGRQPTLYRAL